MEENKKLIDHRFNIQSYEQFVIDNQKMKYNKICMTEVINADMMIATFGEEKYNKTSTEVLEMGNVAYKHMGIGHLIHVYVHSYKTFMAVANDDISDEDFYNLMKTNHEQYEIIQSQQTGLAGVSRFVVAFGDNLIDRAKSAYHLNQHLQTNFIVATNEKELLKAQEEKNVQLFDLLTYAIKNDKVIPYYQGIFDNKDNIINKYEALMRICDQNGKVCPPGMFLDAAKSFKMYLPLSKILIDKALLAFENKESELSLNITLYEIQSSEFRQWLLNRLESHPNPSKIILEFVETEDYNSNSSLSDFLACARKIGCKIAVDDFGVGFATYTSIISLKPDIIKIDGDIIKNLLSNIDNQIILQSIRYMAKLIGSETTAEFVEDEFIQEVILENNIDYSQGYHYAKPAPIEELEIK